jgi:hypothetical protein
MTPVSRVDKWLTLVMLVNVFPWWQIMLAIVAAAIAGTLEDGCWKSGPADDKSELREFLRHPRIPRLNREFPPGHLARSILGAQLSASLRESLIEQIAALNSPDEAAAWAHWNLPAKNTLTTPYAQGYDAMRGGVSHCTHARRIYHPGP